MKEGQWEESDRARLQVNYGTFTSNCYCVQLGHRLTSHTNQFSLSEADPWQ